jgi:hypothetical protein
MNRSDSIVKVDNSAPEFGPDRYTYPLYQFPLSMKPMGSPSEDNGRGPTIQEQLASRERKRARDGS